MVSQRVWTSLKSEDYKRFKTKVEKKGTSEYELARQAIIHNLNPNNRTPLTEYATKELLAEVWRRIP